VLRAHFWGTRCRIAQGFLRAEVTVISGMEGIYRRP
jgi:hypothetical protein